MLRCPGQQPVSVVEDLTVDAYISPRELKEGGKELNKHLALMVQTFGTEVALPHLRRFARRCFVEEIEPPTAPSKSSQISSPHPKNTNTYRTREISQSRRQFISPKSGYERWSLYPCTMPSHWNLGTRHCDPSDGPPFFPDRDPHPCSGPILCQG